MKDPKQQPEQLSEKVQDLEIEEDNIDWDEEYEELDLEDDSYYDDEDGQQ